MATFNDIGLRGAECVVCWMVLVRIVSACIVDATLNAAFLIAALFIAVYRFAARGDNQLQQAAC